LEAREVKDDQEPEIIDVDVDTTAVKGEGASSATITLEFDKAIYGVWDEDIFDVEEHFDLYEQEVASRYKITDADNIKADYKKDKDGEDIKDTIVVEIEGLNINEKRLYDYILEVRNFRSESGGNKMYRDYVDFEIKEGKDLTIVDIEAKYYEKDDESVIVVEFNRAVDRRRAEDETNYLFKEKVDGKAKDVEDLEGKIEVHKNGESVTITIPEFDYKDRPIFEVLEAVRDKDNNKLVGDRVYNLVEDKWQDEVAEEEKKAKEEEEEKVQEFVKTGAGEIKEELDKLEIEAFDALDDAVKDEVARVLRKYEGFADFTTLAEIEEAVEDIVEEYNKLLAAVNDAGSKAELKEALQEIVDYALEYFEASEIAELDDNVIDGEGKIKDDFVNSVWDAKGDGTEYDCFGDIVE